MERSDEAVGVDVKDEDWGDDIGFACGDCRFFEGDTAAKTGVCRRFPPTGALKVDDGEDFQQANFATTVTYEWCGEFELSPARRSDWQLHKATSSP